MRLRGLALLLLALVLAGVFVLQPLQVLWGLPVQLRLLPGQAYPLDLGPVLRVVDPEQSGWLIGGGGRRVAIRAPAPGASELELRLLGLPVRSLRVESVPEVEVVPGGQAIGVLLTEGGLVIARLVPVQDVDGVEHHPARGAGLQPGDVLVQVAGRQVGSPAEVAALVDQYGRAGLPLEVVVQRGGTRLRRTLTPVLTRAGPPPAYRIGLHLEDPAAGVGTLTFYHPRTRRYGALGHLVADGSGRHVEVSRGRIVEAHIRGVRRGSRGLPGEKIGFFEDSRAVLGTIERNTTYGIFGTLHELPATAWTRGPVPVALAHQVRPGPAEILTVLRGKEVERFAIQILSVQPHRRHDGKGLVLEITDPRLQQDTQGIVQGMSGSPILQDGRLAGAVTHVFVNAPQRGYGVLAEWMVYEAGILPGAGGRLPAAPPEARAAVGRSRTSPARKRT